jgi:hypothetical protein
MIIIDPELRVLRLKLIIGTLGIVLFISCGKIIPELWTNVIMLEHPLIFDKDFVPEIIDYYPEMDSEGNESMEPVFSDEDQKIIDKQNELLEKIYLLEQFSFYLGIAALIYTLSIGKKYFKARKKVKNTLNL